MTTTIKITELTNIGANLASSTVIPVVNMAGTPTTEKTILGNVANFILAGAGGNYVSAAKATTATTANTVLTNAQPNITSMGNLTGLTVSNVTGIVNFSNTANISLGNVSNLHITGGTIGQILSTDGAGNLSWTSDTTTYGNSNVVTLLSGFGSNTITTTGNVSVGNIIGNGQALTNIAGANVSGFVANANIANTAFSVAGANVSGFVANANVSNTAFSVAAANVSGLGNIATINLTGSNANVLYGNGVFAAVAGGANTGNVTFNDVTVQGVNGFGLNLSAGPEFTANLAYLQVRSGDVASHIHLDTGNNIAYDLIVGDDDKFVQVSSTGNIIMRSYDGNISYTMTLDTTGNLTVPGNIVGAATVAIDNRASGNTADIQLYSADDILLQARDRSAGSGSEGGDINIFAGDSAEDSDSSGGDIQIIAGDGGNANVDFAGLGGFITIAGGRGGNASTGVGNYPAEDGGELTLRAGDAGNNNGNIDRGADGGAVLIEAGDSTGNGINGGGITLTTGLGGTNALAGYVEINIPSSDLGTGGAWIFTGTGNLNLPTNGSLNLTGGGINQDNNETLLITAYDNDGIVNSSLELSPGDTLTRIEQWSGQDSQSFTTADWATGVYTNQGGLGAVQFTGAANIVDFVNSVFGATGHISISVNGGPLLFLDGTGGGATDITFYTPTLPAVNPTTVTSFEYFYSYKSGVEIDYDSNEVNIYANDADISLQTTNNRDIALDSSGDVTLTANSALNWTFGTDGNLTLPGNTFAVNYANGTAVSLGGNVQSNIANGNSNVNIATANGNVTIAAVGNTTMTITGTGSNITGTLNVTGNANIGNLGTTTAIITTGNITTINSGLLQNGNSNITLTANGNVSIQAAGSTVELVVTSTGANVTGTLSATGNVTGSYLISTHASGNEGGEISLAQPPNGNLSGGIIIDAYQNTVRMFEQGGTARGLSVDIANSPAGGGTAIGYRDIPQVAAGNVTLAATDAGKHYYSTTAGNLTLTIPLNSTVPFTTGTAISIVVQAAGNILVNAASGVTLYMAGNSTAANRVVGGYGMATLMKVASDTWMINGTGVS